MNAHANASRSADEAHLQAINSLKKPDLEQPARRRSTRLEELHSLSNPAQETGKLAANMQIERKVKLVTEQKNIDKPSPVPEFPMKVWSVRVFLLDQDGNEHEAKAFNKVTYNLHPSFENPNQTFHDPPFICQNEGWGEFEMSIDMYTTEKTKCTVYHDLNFQKPKYEAIQTISIKNPSQALLQILRETGPVANEEDPRAAKVRKTNDGKKKKSAYDIEKMADAMTKLNEDDLLIVIQMIHDHKTEDTYTKNDVEAGEFTVDLYTMPENLIRMVWDFLVEGKHVQG